MFRRPSSRRKSGTEELQLNLVPMLDALVTMVSFLLISMGYMSISVIETPAPLLAPAEQQVKQLEKDKEVPLQLTAHILPDKILVSDWTGSRENHEIGLKPDPNKPADQPNYDLEAFHKLMLDIKQRHPKEVQLILKPDASIPYDSLVQVMDSAREYEKTDPVPPMVANAQGVMQPDTSIFPNVIFGNILSQ